MNVYALRICSGSWPVELPSGSTRRSGSADMSISAIRCIYGSYLKDAAVEVEK